MTTLHCTVGIDLGDRFSDFHFLDADGNTLEKGRIVSTEAAFRSKFGQLRPCRIALEVGTHSPWVSRVLSSFGHEVLVANPRKLRLIYQSERKNDQLDAANLAKVARLDPTLLYPIQHRTKETQEARATLHSRDLMVRTRVKWVNHIRGVLKSFGIRVESGAIRSFAQRAEDAIPDSLSEALLPLVQLIRNIDVEIRRYNRKVEELANTVFPETKRFRQIKGVGPITLLGYVTTIENPYRFRNSRAVGAYVGLCPKQRQSGKRDPELGITKCGDRYLRKTLVQAAHYILGPFGEDCHLRRYGERIAQTGNKGSKKRAIIAVARKLAVLLHKLWITQSDYQPFPTPASPSK